MEIDVIGNLPSVIVGNDADVAAAVCFLRKAYEQRAILLLGHVSRKWPSILGPGNFLSQQGGVTAEMDLRTGVGPLLVIVRLRDSIRIFYESHAIFTFQKC